ncbi:MAG: SpoIIE family protein phosphatase [Planctomycetes bacterium]|nr:SpoIIE family protein phosphatase [Planctomycetota bacterium]
MPEPRRESELERARKVQLSMLPETPGIEGLDIACGYSACDHIGGDFYDFILIDRWRLGVVVADVSGHGTAAALLMAATKKVMQICGKGSLSPRQTLLEVNDSIRADLPRGMFLTALYGVIDIRNHRFCFASAGHNPPLLRRGEKLRDRWPQGNAPPLGLMTSELLREHMKEEFVQLAPGDTLLFYTDGLTEARRSDEMYGVERLMERLRTSLADSAQALLSELRADVATFRAGAAQGDDETLLVVRALTPPADPAPLVKGMTSSSGELPRVTSELVGRDAEVAVIADLLRDAQSRPMTVTGPVGAGKSRVALAAVEVARGTFPGGIYFVDLKAAAGIADVCRLVAGVLGLPEDDSQLGARIAAALKSPAGRTLLVLDNCERCHEASGLCLTQWKQRNQDLQVLATSRVPLGVGGEQTLALKPLSTPRTDDKLRADVVLQASPAVALFMAKARKADPSFKLTDQNVGEVSRICRRLDGLPQAIELAAARVAVLSPRQILDRLDKRFELLAEEGGGKGSLEAALAWSFELLSPGERQALLLLAHFPTGFQLDVATRALARLKGESPEGLVGALMRHNLLHYDAQPELGGERRFQLYESIRLFALDAVKAAGLEAQAQAAFESALLGYVMHWWWIDQRHGSPEARRRVRLELEPLLQLIETTRVPETRAWASIVAAPMLGARGQQDRAMTILRGGMDGLYPGSDEWKWIQVTDGQLRVIEAPGNVLDLLEKFDGDPLMNFNALLVRSYALHRQGNQTGALELARKAASITGLEPIKRAIVNDRIGVYLAAAGHHEDARQAYETALRIAREQGDTLVLARIMHNLGWLLQRRGKPAEAEPYQQEALQLSQAEGERGMESSNLGSLALTLHLTGRKPEAEATMLRALRIAREVSKPFTEAAHLNTLARIYHEQDRHKEALDASLASRALSREIGAKHSEAVAESNVAALQIVMGQEQGGLESLENSYKLLVEVGDARSALSALSNIGAVYMKRWDAHRQRRDLLLAIEYLQRGCRGRREQGFDPLVDCEAELARLLHASGKTSEARALADRALADARKRVDDLSVKAAVDLEKLLEETAPKAPKAPSPRRRRRKQLPGGAPRPRGVAPKRRPIR